MQLNVNNPVVETFFDFEGQPSTGFVQVKWYVASNSDDLRFDFTDLDTSLAQLLGFVDPITGAGQMVRNWVAPFGGVGYPVTTYWVGGQTAQFDEIGSYLLQSSLCVGKGLPVNSIAGNCISQIVPENI